MNYQTRVFREANNLFFSLLAKEFTVTSKTLLRGYFIFDMGTNSVAHFTIKECPDWKFGIWWNIDEERPIVHGQFFARHSIDLDKFKPSRSNYAADFCFTLTRGKTHVKIADEISLYTVYDILSFIHKYPYVAYYRECHTDSPICSYVTKTRAYWEYLKDKREDHRDRRLRTKYNKAVLTFMTKFFSDWPEHFIADYSEDTSPQFELTVLRSSEFDLDPGCYTIFESEDEETRYKEGLEKIRKRYKQFFSEASEFMTVVKKPQFKRLKRKYGLSNN